jgi:flagellar basal-body rod protein FlgG
MFRALYLFVIGMEAQQTQIDIIANNLANVNTMGFKKSRGEFQDLYYQQLRTGSVDQTTGTTDPMGLEVGTGVRVMASQKMFTSGDMIQTGNAFDMAIEGEGFFRVIMPDGSYSYTRSGNFKLNDRGQLVTLNGYMVDPGIEVSTDAAEITISREGAVNVVTAGSSTPTQIAELRLYNFQNPGGLQSQGRGLYSETAASGQFYEATPGSDGMGAVVQGQLESSNVKVVEEMIDLISAQRAYEVNSKVVQATDQMLREATNMR